MITVSNIENDNMTDLRIFAIQALIGEIGPNIRKIYVDYERKKNKIHMHFYWDDAIYPRELEKKIEEKMKINFSSQFLWELKSFIIPYPALISEEGFCIYSRYEPIPEELCEE